MSITYTATLPVRDETVLYLSGLLRGDRSVDLSPFDLPGLAEHRQEYHPPAWGKPVADAYCAAIEVEPQFASLARQVPRVRLPEGLGLIGEDVGDRLDFRVVLLGAQEVGCR